MLQTRSAAADQRDAAGDDGSAIGGGPVRLDYETAIVGAGFAGLIAALELKKAGRNSFVIFERAAEVGGVWRDNVYPGCVCDVRSQLYWRLASSARPERRRHSASLRLSDARISARASALPGGKM